MNGEEKRSVAISDGSNKYIDWTKTLCLNEMMSDVLSLRYSRLKWSTVSVIIYLM